METPNYYIRRTIELETELRLLKEQLTQAQGGTQYLLNCVAQQQQVQNSANIDRQIRELRAENALLRRRLELADTAYARGNKNITYETPLHSRKLALRDRLDLQASLDDSTDKVDSGHCSAEDDLLSFDDAECSPSPAALLSPGDTDFSKTLTDESMIDSPYGTPLTPITPGKPRQGGFGKADRTSPTGLRISNLPIREQASVQRPQHVSRHPRYNINESFAAVESEDEKLIAEDSNVRKAFTEHDTNDDDAWQAIRSPPPPAPPAIVFNSRFADGEHNQLAGYACFIEDMSEDERTKYWSQRAKHDRHSADDWRKYYEEVVRPAYLAKTKQREETVAGASRTKPEAGVARDDVDGGLVNGIAVTALNGGSPSTQGLHGSKWAPQRAARDIGDCGSSTVMPDSQDSQPSIPPARSLPDPTNGQSLTSVTENKQPELQLDSSSGEALVDNGQVQTPEQVTADAAVQDVQSSEAPPSLFLEDLPPLPKIPSPADSSLSPRRSFEPSRAPAQLVRTPRTGLSPRRSTPRRNDSPLFPVPEPVLFFQYGSPNSSLYHAVCISNIPTTVSLADVLAKVHGGRIVTATYHSTVEMKTKPAMTGNTVLVVFLDSRKAMAFVDCCQAHPIQFPSEDAGQMATAKITLIQTPSRPLPPQLLHDMRERNLSRVLFVLDGDHKWSSEDAIQAMLKHIPSIKRPIAAGRDESSILYFEFADVRDAADAWNAVDEASWFFAGASKGFWPDPCDLRKAVETSAEADDVETRSNLKEKEAMGSFVSESTVVDTPPSTAQTSFTKTEEDGKGAGV